MVERGDSVILHPNVPPQTQHNKDSILSSSSKFNITDLLNLDWHANEDRIRQSLNNLVHVVSLNNTYINSCFSKLVRCFVPVEIPFAEDDKKFDIALTEKRAQLAHATIKQIISTVPLSVNVLYQALKENFPHKRFDATVQWVFIKHALLVTYYCPGLTELVFTLCVDKTISIDVEIKLEDVPEEDEEEDQFQFDDQEGKHDRVDKAKEDANKLDGMMAILFQYIDAILGRASHPMRPQSHPLLILPPPPEAPMHPEQLFQVLMHAFERVILNTHKSKYTQFLLFYACRLSALGSSQAYSQRFIAFLLGKLLDSSTSKYIRIAVVAYLGSYVARASYLPRSLVKDTLSVLMDWAQRYITTTENNYLARRASIPNNLYSSAAAESNNNSNSNYTIDVDMHGLFYIVAQAMYYIFCFHHKELVKMGGMGALAEGFRKISESKQNPFKVCLTTVVREFSRIVGDLQWFNAAEILLRNERVVLPTKTSFGGANQLECFFPFDPYLLKYSSGCIKDLYSEWNGAEDEEGEDSDEEEDTQESFASADNSMNNSVTNTPMSSTPLTLSRDTTPKDALFKRVSSLRREEEISDEMMAMSASPQEIRFHFSLEDNI